MNAYGKYREKTRNKALNLRIKSLFMILLAVLLQVSCDAESAGSDEKPSTQMNGYKIRGGFMNFSDIELLPTLSLNGLNTVLVKFPRMYAPMTVQQNLLITKWSKACEMAGLQFLPTMNYWSIGEIEWFTPKFHYVTNDQEYIKTPCPLEWNTYKRSIHDRLIEFAKLSQTIHIAGVVFNTEMFASEFNLYFNVCYCDNCWDNFRQIYSECPELSISKRQKYLEKNNMTNLYYNFAVDRLAAMARLTRQAVDKINPLFINGFGGLDISTPFHEGLSKGFGSGENPVYIFSRETYKKGYSDAIKNTIANFKRKNINIRFVAGLWQDQFPIDNLPEQYYYCAKDSSGYWVYTIQSLNPDWKEPLAAGRDDYWQAMKKANAELDKLIQYPDHKTTLKIRTFEPPLSPVDYKSVRVEPLQYVRADATLDMDSTPLRMRGVNKLVFIANERDLIKFCVQFDQRWWRTSKVKSAEVMLLTNKGQVLANGKTTKDKVAVMETEAPYTGSYCIVLNSDLGTNLQVISFTHPYSIEVSRKSDLHLDWPVSNLYLYKPPDQKIPKLSITVGNTSETAKAVFATEAGWKIAEYVIRGKQIITLPDKNDFAEQVIVLSFPDLSWKHKPHLLITVQDGLGKYISPFKSGLVRQ